MAVRRGGSCWLRMVPQAEYVIGRTQVLRGFLGRPSIFVLGELEAAYGERARVNLMREMASLADTVADHPAGS